MGKHSCAMMFTHTCSVTVSGKNEGLMKEWLNCAGLERISTEIV